MTEEIKLTVADVVAETPDACSLVFEPPADGLDYRPGQFLTLRIPSEQTGSVARCYSLASSPHTGEPPKVTVKRTCAGYGSNWLCDNVKPGDTIEILPPAGLFTPSDLDADLLLLAAGSGITPVISIAKSAMLSGRGSVALLYANRDAESVIFARELDALACDRFTTVHWLESDRGLPDAAGLAAELDPLLGTHGYDRPVFLCGPAAFMDAARTALTELGVPRDRIHAEVYASLSGDPFAAPDLELDDAETAGDTATVDIQLDGADHTLVWPRSRSLLDTMLSAGLDAPFSCQSGQCAACMCTLVDGEVAMADNEVLDPEDVADGYILACQSRPVTSHVRVRY
jgi:3-ketosteroid 9alpha-monooxygenase subunit B